MTTQNVIISPLILSHYPKAILVLYEISKDRKDRDSYTTKLCPWGIYAATRPRVWPWLLDAASPVSCHSSRPDVWEDRSTLTQFSQFSAQLWRRTYESSLLCDFEKASCVLNFTSQMALCRAPTAAPTDGGSRRGKRHKWCFCSQFSELEAIPSTPFPARASVSSWHTASRVCLFYLGVHACCVSDLMPCQCSAVFTREEEEFETQNTANQTIRWNEGKTKIWIINIIMSRLICWSFPPVNLPLFGMVNARSKVNSTVRFIKFKNQQFR